MGVVFKAEKRDVMAKSYKTLLKPSSNRAVEVKIGITMATLVYHTATRSFGEEKCVFPNSKMLTRVFWASPMNTRPQGWNKLMTIRMFSTKFLIRHGPLNPTESFGMFGSVFGHPTGMQY